MEGTSSPEEAEGVIKVEAPFDKGKAKEMEGWITGLSRDSTVEGRQEKAEKILFNLDVVGAGLENIPKSESEARAQLATTARIIRAVQDSIDVAQIDRPQAFIDYMRSLYEKSLPSLMEKYNQDHERYVEGDIAAILAHAITVPGINSEIKRNVAEYVGSHPRALSWMFETEIRQNVGEKEGRTKDQRYHKYALLVGCALMNLKGEEKAKVYGLIEDMLGAGMYSPEVDEDGFSLGESQIALPLLLHFMEKRDIDTATGILGSLVNQYGLDSNKLTAAWLMGIYKAVPEVFNGMLERNYKAIKELERVEPGCCRFLSQEYGVFDFARYPIRTLLRQYRERDNKNLPYGVVIYPRYDHSGAFYGGTVVPESLGQASLIEQLDNSLREEAARQSKTPLSAEFSNYPLIRIIECSSKMDIARMLIKLDRQFGEVHKISFALIGGHGARAAIQFGGLKDRELLYLKDLVRDPENFKKGAGVSRTGEFFEHGPSIVLESCETGGEGGIAQQLSEVMGAHVIAPEGASQLKSLIAHIDEAGKISLEGDYLKGTTRASYAKGILKNRTSS